MNGVLHFIGPWEIIYPFLAGLGRDRVNMRRIAQSTQK